MPIVPSTVKGISSNLHGKTSIMEGLNLLCSVSLLGFNLKLRKKSMEIWLKLQVTYLQQVSYLLKDLQTF